MVLSIENIDDKISWKDLCFFFKAPVGSHAAAVPKQVDLIEGDLNIVWRAASNNLTEMKASGELFGLLDN